MPDDLENKLEELLRKIDVDEEAEGLREENKRLRKEKDRYLCVKAKLKMGAKGLPGFVVLKEIYFSSRKEAEKQIYAWMKS